MAVKITITQSKDGGADVQVDGATTVSSAEYRDLLEAAVEELNIRIEAAENDEGDAFEQDMAEDEE